MEKSLHIMGKSMLPLSLILLIIASVTLVTIPSVSASGAYTKLYPDPKELSISAPGQNFTINVYIDNVTNFGAWEWKLWYNTTILDAVCVSKTWLTDNNTDWVPSPIPGTFHPTYGINDTMGRVFYSALLPLFTPFTGSGPILTINFTAIAAGNCTLTLNETVLGYNTGPPLYQTGPIPHDTLEGWVNVVPEFPILAMPLLLTATLAAALLGKIVWSRKRKDALR